MDKRRVDELGISYVEKLSLYEEYASRIRNLVQDLIDREGIECQAIDGWAKRPDELIRSLSAGGEEMLSAIDLVTVRVLLRLPEDVHRIERVVSEEFAVDASRSVPSSGLDDPLRFGYPAVVYILSLSDSRSGLREWEKYRGLSFRLELRTMIQDAWAAIAPSVSLTVGAGAEKRMQRRMHRIAMLLEEADEGFRSLWSDMKDEALLVPPRPAAGPDRSAPVAAERLFTEEELYGFFRDDAGMMSRWNSIVLEAGFPAFIPDSDYLRGSFKHLYEIFRAAGIDTLSEVRSFLSEVEEGGLAARQLRTVYDRWRDVPWRVDPFSAIFILVLNLKWDALKDKDLVRLNVKQGNDRIMGAD